MRNIIFYFTFFFYIFPISFIFLPFSTHVLMGIIGFMVCALGVNKLWSFVRNTRKIWKGLILISLTSLLSIVLNPLHDDKFLTYFFPVIVEALAVVFLSVLAKRLKINLSFIYLCKCIVLVNTVQISIALVMFFSPVVYDFLFSVQKESSYSLETIEGNLDLRLLGFGSLFFYSGIINSVSLLCNAVLIGHEKSRLLRLLLVIVHVSIFLIGSVMSRTTYVGMGLSILILLKNRGSKSQLLFYFIASFIALVVATMVMVPADYLQGFFDYGFEILSNYLSGYGAESKSTNQLQEIYVFPESINTWLFGDALWTDPRNKDLYYMHTDVGYLRMIFYSGLCGLTTYFTFVYAQIKEIHKHYGRDTNWFCLALGLLVVVLMFKGFTDITNILMLFIVSTYYNQRICIK